MFSLYVLIILVILAALIIYILLGRWGVFGKVGSKVIKTKNIFREGENE